ncbi:hypothetical protein [Microbulbifer sediminum]|uniref:hypothetical protein n=1 Tax=Microbulbifer sediminum TaxID=2904250 RepID=UPI001F276AB6|nr:hypothetical protein [Microbulbifer sediminum]
MLVSNLSPLLRLLRQGYPRLPIIKAGAGQPSPLCAESPFRDQRDYRPLGTRASSPGKDEDLAAHDFTCGHPERDMER